MEIVAEWTIKNKTTHLGCTINLGNLITLSTSLDCFSFEFKTLLLAYILALSQKQKEMRKDTQVLWVVYFSRTGYFISVLSSGIQSYEQLSRVHLDVTKSTKPRDGPLGVSWPTDYKSKNLCQKTVETSNPRQHQNWSQLRKPEQWKNLDKYLWLGTMEFTPNTIYTVPWIPPWHLFSLCLGHDKKIMKISVYWPKVVLILMGK